MANQRQFCSDFDFFEQRDVQIYCAGMLYEQIKGEHGEINRETI